MITVGDLKDQTGMNGPRPIIYCPLCGSECSANKSDYFMFTDKNVFTCCGEPMQLVMKRTVYEPVKP